MNAGGWRNVCNAMLSLLAMQTDAFELGTAWASAFAPIAARRTTVRTVDELRQAVARGGTVHLVAGTYRVSGQSLVLNAGTVLEGDGQGKTIVEVGAIDKAGDYGIALFGSEIGLRNLTVRNANGDGKPSGVVRGHWGTNANERTFFDNVQFAIGNGLPIGLSRPTDALVRDCKFVSTCPTQGPLVMSGGVRFRFESNVVDYRAGRPNLAFASDSAFRENEFRIDGRYRGPGRAETGGVELSYANNVDFDRNKVIQYGPEGTGDNDGEMINVQSSNVPEWQGAGSVVSADGVTVRTDMRWGDDPWYSPRHARTKRRVIYLLSGPGAGQWRWAAPGEDGTVAIDRPWSIAPRPGDQVSLGSVTGFRLRVTNNTVEGGVRGVLFYSGAIQCRISGNVVRNSGGISMRADSRVSKRTPRSSFENYPIWDCKIVGNKVTNSTGWRPAAVAIADFDVSDTGLPLAIRGLTVTGNTIQGQNQSQKPDALGGFDGIAVTSVNEVRGAKPRPGRVSGVVVQDNALSGAAQRIRQ